MNTKNFTRPSSPVNFCLLSNEFLPGKIPPRLLAENFHLHRGNSRWKIFVQQLSFTGCSKPHTGFKYDSEPHYESKHGPKLQTAAKSLMERQAITVMPTQKSESDQKAYLSYKQGFTTVKTQNVKKRFLSCQVRGAGKTLRNIR